MYAVGYFLEVGIGTSVNMSEYALSPLRIVGLKIANVLFLSAISYYKKAADSGDKRAAQRLKGSQNQPIPQPGDPSSVLRRSGPDGDSHGGKGKDGKDCVIM